MVVVAVVAAAEVHISGPQQLILLPHQQWLCLSMMIVRWLRFIASGVGQLAGCATTSSMTGGMEWRMSVTSPLFDDVTCVPFLFGA